jgi:ornithine cyclodeaminase
VAELNAAAALELTILGRGDLEALLPPPVAIAAVEQAMRAVSRGDALLPLRTSMALPGTNGRFVLMPGWLGTTGVDAPARVFGLKSVAKFPRATNDPLGTHVGAVLLFDADSGRLLALLEGGTLTALRTAAASALATRVLAPADASALAVLGTGEAAFRHAVAICAVRPIREVRLWGRTPTHADALLRRVRAALDAGAASGANAMPGGGATADVVVRAYADAADAVRGAGVVCTTTAAPTPILAGAWLSPGTHVNLVGSAIPTTAEIDVEGVSRGRLYVDSREAAAAEAGELRAAIAAGAVPSTHVLGEIGDVLLGRVTGRTSPREITIYKSLGLAPQDLAAAAWALAGARAGARGRVVDLAR